MTVEISAAEFASSPFNARALLVLSRFPRHLAATDPGKRFGSVAIAVASQLDVLSRQSGDVRVAHRLGEVPTLADLRGLGAMHGLGEASYVPIALRVTALVAAAGDPPDVEAVARLVNLAPAVLEEFGSEIRAAVARTTRHVPAMSLRRAVIVAAIAAHRIGNATPAALLSAAAGYLGLEVEEIIHTEQRWWHLAGCRDLLRLSPPASLDGGDVVPGPDLLALEENPFRPADLEPTSRRHGQRFRVQRGGLEDVDVTVQVVGTGTRTVRPTVVHVEAGRGLVFEGNVPNGQTLSFRSSGRVTLDGVDVTGSAWEFTGAVFAAGREPLTGRDFVFGDATAQGRFGDREATFVTTAPAAGALATDAAFPHGASAVGPLRLPRGRSHWVGLVRIAHAGASPVQPAVPRLAEGRFGAAVFAPAAGSPDPAFRIGFGWEEREPFAARILIPRRFEGLADDSGTPVRELLRLLLDRHRAAGVDVRVEYADPRWTLGAGIVRDNSDDPLGTVLAGTELWPDPQPG